MSKSYPPAWPDEALERTMLEDGLPDQYGSINDAACHVRALLERVRMLEKEVERLLPFEAAMRSMAAQFICPKTTAEEMAAEILRSDRKHPLVGS